MNERKKYNEKKWKRGQSNKVCFTKLNNNDTKFVECVVVYLCVIVLIKWIINYKNSKLFFFNTQFFNPKIFCFFIIIS